MKPINIINKLNESAVTVEQVKQFPEWIKEEIKENDKVTYWYCPDCDEYFKEPNSVKTDMEDFYGVGSVFQDHHYQDLLMCPNCDGDLQEVTVGIEDITEAFLDNEELRSEIYERYEKEHPDTVGEYYIKQGTHHCDIFEDYPEYADEIVKEMI